MKRFAYQLGALAFLLLVIIAVALNEKKSVDVWATNLVSQQTTVRVGSAEFTVEKAVTAEEQSQGLSYRPSLPGGTGMLFVFSPEIKPGFWMREMKFPLDIIWIKSGRVVDISRHLPIPEPNTNPDDLLVYYPGDTVTHALEVNAGEADKISVGEVVEIRDITAL